MNLNEPPWNQGSLSFDSQGRCWFMLSTGQEAVYVCQRSDLPPTPAATEALIERAIERHRLIKAN